MIRYCLYLIIWLAIVSAVVLIGPSFSRAGKPARKPAKRELR